MKKSIFIICILISALGLTAFAIVNWSKTAAEHTLPPDSKIIQVDQEFINALILEAVPDLLYKVDHRFVTSISKEALSEAKSIADILPKKATESEVDYNTTRISILEDSWETEASESGNSLILNEAQKNLLESVEYSSDIFIGADCGQERNKNTEWTDNSLIYYISVTPKNEAKFPGGMDELTKYLRANSKKETAIIQKSHLKPGRVNFTVSKNGTITNVKIGATCGYPSVDDFLVEMIRNMPHKWQPASNAKGEKVDQEFVFFFGMQGC